MKKKIVYILCAIIFIIALWFFIQYIRIKTAKIEVTLKEDMVVEFNEDKKVSDFITSINGKIINDYKIDTKTIGKKKIPFEFINDDKIKVKYSYEVEVVDNIAPLIWLGNVYRVKKGSDIDLTKKILCGDNYDANPNCFIEGEYDLNKTGKYSLVFKAIDSSGNEEQQPFTLTVYEPTPKKDTSTKPSKKEPVYTAFKEVVNTHKTDKTKIGIDVSKWQGDIDFEKIKQAGVEFIIIKVGSGTYGNYVLDPKFEQNIKKANEYDIDVGVYFYSYTNSVKNAKKDAEWVLNQIKGYQISLPIAFDWEEWSDFNQYHLSFFGLTNVAEEFLNTVSKAGYEGMLYSSKSYLESIWFPTKYDIWLAHYTDKTNYNGQYRFWQLCDDGKIDGINGYVDIDIMMID